MSVERARELSGRGRASASSFGFDLAGDEPAAVAACFAKRESSDPFFCASGCGCSGTSVRQPNWIREFGNDYFKSEQRHTHLDKVFGIILNLSDSAVHGVELQISFERSDQRFEPFRPRLAGEPEFNLGWI